MSIDVLIFLDSKGYLYYYLISSIKFQQVNLCLLQGVNILFFIFLGWSTRDIAI